MNWKPYEHTVQYYETDQMAIVHHSNYIRWFEEARVDWMSQLGIPYQALEARGIIIPVLSVSAEYRTMTRFGETVRITPRLTRYSGVRMEVSYEITNAETGELRTRGTTAHCFLNRSYRPVTLKRYAPEYDAIFQAAAETGNRE